MSRTAIALAAVVAAGLAFVLSGVGAGASSSQRPSLRLAQMVPLRIAGSHFRAHERVRVTATVSAMSRTRRVRASGKGSFVVVFAIGAGRCSEVRVIAVGGGGIRATLKRLPSPACLPA
jgi:multidrug efflux pump subunit AcrA (membrane-fusion protein)